MENLGNGIGRAADHFEMMTLTVVAFLVIVSLILLGISSRNKSGSFKTVYGIVNIITALLAILCFQHEVGLYKSGVLLVILSILGFVKVFKGSGKAEEDGDIGKG